VHAVTFALLLVAASAAIGAPATDFHLDSLLACSVGGNAAVEKLRSMGSIYASGTMSLNGTPGAFVSYVTLPDKFYLKVDLGDYSIIQAYDGVTAWQKDMNGMVSELHGYERRSLESQVYLQTYSFLFQERLPGSAAYRGIVEREGEEYHEVLIMPFNVDTVYAYLDLQTCYQTIGISHLDNLEVVTTTSDFRPVGGVVIGYYSRSETSGVPVYTEFLVDSVAFDTPIDPAIYSLALAERDYRFPAGADSVVIPMEYADGHIFVTVTVNGLKRLRLMLDTGASANLFSEGSLDSLNLPVVGTSAGKGMGGYSEISLVKSDSVEVGGLTLFRQVAGVADLSSLQGMLRFDGLLGQDFLSRFPIMVDYQAQRLIVYNPDNFTPPEGGSEVPFRLTMQVPTIKAELLGLPGEFLLDLGSGFGLIVHRHFADMNDLEHRLDDLQDYQVAIGGLGASLRGKSGYAATLAFGDVRINSLRVILPETSEGLAGSRELAGNMGNLLLQQFRLLFDYRNSRVFFYPAEVSNN